MRFSGGRVADEHPGPRAHSPAARHVAHHRAPRRRAMVLVRAPVRRAPTRGVQRGAADGVNLRDIAVAACE